jgi:undecaprenyl-diphosphatase
MTNHQHPFEEKARATLAEIDALDRAVYVAIAATPTPTMDAWLRRLSQAANYSRISISMSLGLAALGGSSGRRTAARAMTAVAITSATVNLVAKRLLVRGRPDRAGAAVIEPRHVSMPTSTSFPSGHTASAFAFATVAGAEIPALSLPLHVLATLVGYSRVHTGVHYPGDVIAGALIGVGAGSLVNHVAQR